MRSIFLSVAATSLIAASTPTPFDRSAWQEDFAQLKRALEDGYANLAWKGATASGVDLPALNRVATESLAHADNDTDAANAIRVFVAGFRDGHFSELPYMAAGENMAREPDQPNLDPTRPQAGCAALGFAPTEQVAFSLPLEQLPDFELVSDGLDSSFRTGIIHRQDMILGIIRIQAFRARAFPMACLHAWEQLRRSGRPITADSLMKERNAVWVGDLAGAIAGLQARGINALAIDVGRNNGGDDSGDWLARLFTAGPVRSARLMMVDSPIAASYLDDQLADLDMALKRNPAAAARTMLLQATAYFTAQRQAIGKARCDLSWVWREKRSWSPDGCNRLLPTGFAGGFSAGLSKDAYNDPRAASLLSSSSRIAPWFGTWKGPAYVLTDKRSYSSAEMFAAVMQDNHIAKIVGARTGGDGCGFMISSPPTVLRHSRLRFRMPNCMRLRADGTNEGAGIAPDIPVLPVEGESDRARASRAVSLIIEDARAAKTPG